MSGAAFSEPVVAESSNLLEFVSKDALGIEAPSLFNPWCNARQEMFRQLDAGDPAEINDIVRAVYDAHSVVTKFNRQIDAVKKGMESRLTGDLSPEDVVQLQTEAALMHRIEGFNRQKLLTFDSEQMRVVTAALMVDCLVPQASFAADASVTPEQRIQGEAAFRQADEAALSSVDVAKTIVNTMHRAFVDLNNFGFHDAADALAAACMESWRPGSVG